jgi:hypothetical protein
MATSNELKPEIDELADVTPLSAADILELDYDDDMPTRADGRSHSERPSMYPPPRVDQNDIFMLTDSRRPSLALVDASDEVIDFNDVLRAPPRLPSVGPLPPPTLPPVYRKDAMSSIAPVAMAADDTDKRRAVPERSFGRATYGLGLGFLAGVALAIAVWPSSAPAPAAVSATQPIQTRETIVVSDRVHEPVIHTLSTVEIEGSTTYAAVFGKTASVAEDTGTESATTTAPSESEATMPADTAVEGPEVIAPPAPPAPDLPSFDRASANVALNAAAAAASSCRSDGSPRLPGRVSVTFAPTGRVTTAVVDGGTFAGSTIGGCIARTFRSVRVQPFGGTHITVHKTYTF